MNYFYIREVFYISYRIKVRTTPVYPRPRSPLAYIRPQGRSAIVVRCWMRNLHGLSEFMADGGSLARQAPNRRRCWPTSRRRCRSGLSRAYVSRVLSENDDLTGNDAFWMKIERSLGKLVEARRAQVFQLGAVEVGKLDALRKASLD